MTDITLVPVQSTDDRPFYGGSGRPYITATYYTIDGGLKTIGRPWRDPGAIAMAALRAGAVGTINVSLKRHGKRGLIEVAKWLASDASLMAHQVREADAAARAARLERGRTVLREAIAKAEAEGRADDAASLRRDLAGGWAMAHARD